ncbi:hypothetical protein ECHHL_0457 [Ehrlichia chaffeensis str. Heartland]|nr:hypothetical protein ECHHL_0457 [Ehrlichia chaffeensis str. Heartland]AHX08339.1 hypothetical protein ECHSTV_0589 [Ehrlichia chaffeensis str. Saint Vincent]AHX10770.1 hypothetical protein ECHWP_0454 [Ehrlichia chaffeensis str. West Paces]
MIIHNVNMKVHSDVFSDISNNSVVILYSVFLAIDLIYCFLSIIIAM